MEPSKEETERAPLLYEGSPYEVMKECRRIIKDLGDGGGFAFAPRCEYPLNANLLNTVTLVETARLYDASRTQPPAAQ